MLEFDPECSARVSTLRATITALPSSADDPPVATAWWADIFLPALADAFSCGFVPPRLPLSAERRAGLPNDIRVGYAASPLLQKVWRLTRGYITSPQKQREQARRQQDFDVSLYVPFLHKHLHRHATATSTTTTTSTATAGYPDYTALGEMRVGYPTFAGESTWFLFHAAAQRIADAPAACAGGLVRAFKRMLRYFALAGQPCPHCREHFLSAVSRNDQLWWRRAAGADTARPQPESRLYPLEWLFLGGGKGTAEAKLATVQPSRPQSLVLFLWKLHNAVSATVALSEQCKTSERFDEQPLFRCEDEASPAMGRSWPLAMRYQFWLRDPLLFDAVRGSEAVRSAVQALAGLDGRAVREGYWALNQTRQQRGAEGGAEGGAVAAIQRAAEQLDAAVLATGVLQGQYRLPGLQRPLSRCAAAATAVGGSGGGGGGGGWDVEVGGAEEEEEAQDAEGDAAWEAMPVECAFNHLS
jgi:hypothetical protein